MRTIYYVIFLFAVLYLSTCGTANLAILLFSSVHILVNPLSFNKKQNIHIKSIINARKTGKPYCLVDRFKNKSCYGVDYKWITCFVNTAYDKRKVII